MANREPLQAALELLNVSGPWKSSRVLHRLAAWVVVATASQSIARITGICTSHLGTLTSIVDISNLPICRRFLLLL